MGTTGRPSINKRQKEQARAEKQRDKAAKREQRKVDKKNGVTSGGDDVTTAEGTLENPTGEPLPVEPPQP